MAMLIFVLSIFIPNLIKHQLTTGGWIGRIFWVVAPEEMTKKVVQVSKRFEPEHLRRTCDVPKDRHDWDQLILNPLHLPASHCLFECSRSTGELTVNVAHCNTSGVSVQKAQATLDSLRLGKARRLTTLRKKILNGLNQDMMQFTMTGMSIPQARTRLAKIHLRKNTAGNWPAFFSSIRSYLGNEAEAHLKSIGYNG